LKLAAIESLVKVVEQVHLNFMRKICSFTVATDAGK